MRAALAIMAWLGCTTAFAQDAPKDRHGDPLPANAIARLGTAAFHHHDGILGVAISPDKKRLAVSCNNDLLALWDIPTRKKLKQLKIERLVARAHDLAFSPDGRRLAVRGRDDYGKHKDVRLFDLAAEKDVTPLADKMPQTCAFAPDSKHVAIALGRHDDIVIWDMDAKKETRRLVTADRYICKLAYRDDGKTLVAMNQQGAVTIWDLTDPKKPADMPLKNYVLDITRNGAWTVSGNPLHFYELRPLFSKEKDRKFDKVGGHVAYGQDNDTLLFSLRDEVQIWSIKTAKQVTSVPMSQHLHPLLDLSADGKLLAVGTEHQVRLYDLALPPAERERGWNDHAVSQLAFAPDSKLLAASSQWGNRILLWDVEKAAPARVPRRHYHPTDLRFSGDGRQIWFLTSTDHHSEDCASHKESIVAREERDTVLYRVPDGKTWIRTARSAATRWYSEEDAMRQRTNVEILDADAKKVLRSFDIDGHYVQVTPDGLALLSAPGAWHQDVFARGRGPDPYAAGAWTIWDVATGRRRGQIVDRREGEPPPKEALEFATNRKGAPGIIAYSADGRRVAWWDSARQRLHVNDLASGALVGSTTTPVMGITAFSPDGKTLACSDKQPLLVEVATGGVRTRFDGGQQGILSFAFSPDGALLASGGNDATILLWDPFARRSAKKKERLTDKDLLELWHTLGQPDAEKAYRAGVELAQHPPQCVPFLRERIHAFAESAEVRASAPAIKDLDSERFVVRQQADAKLRRLGALALPALASELEQPRSLESRRRIEKLLGELDAVPTGAWLQAYRGLEVLERIGDAAALKALEGLAAGDAANPVAAESQRCLLRLKARTR